MLNISLQCIGHQLNRSGSQNFKYPTVFLELTSVDKLTTETSGKLPVLLMMSACETVSALSEDVRLRDRLCGSQPLLLHLGSPDACPPLAGQGGCGWGRVLQ